VQHFAIAIDGPAGAGKSTVARELAKRMGLLYIDSGAMYRAVSWLAITHGIDPIEESEILLLLQNNSLQFEKNTDGLLDVYANGVLINSKLRSPEVSNIVSTVSTHRKIRVLMTDWQRQFAEKYSVVMDGRDIGTVVLPDANLKIFLTADLHERALRRENEFAQKGFDLSRDEIMQSMHERDLQDTNRDIAPLCQAKDAILIDSSGKSIAQVVDAIMACARQVSNDDN